MANIRDDMLRRKKALHNNEMCAVFLDFFDLPVEDFMHDHILLGLDVIKLDDYAHAHNGYDEEQHGSFSSFLEAQVSPEFRDWIKELL